ncbi:MAG: hypothetical protein VX738_10815, partial [Planctomycetota bacterium]|nr:hypothetical protein [Planctomycetota bacterium]
MRVLSLTILSRLFFALIVGGLPNVLFAQEEVKNREIYVPFDDLQTILASGIQRIYLPRSEYEELLKKADFKPGEVPPEETVLRSAQYRIAIQGDAASITGDLEVESLSSGLQQLPLGFSGVSLLQVMNGQQPATLVRDSDEGIRLLMTKPGKHQYQFSMSAPVQHAAAKQSLSIQLPHAANSTIDLTVSGNIEIKSGASVLERTVDTATNQTAFKLLAKPGPLVLSMSLNNKLLKSERIVVARNVLVAELTQAIERLHGTFSMQMVQGAASEFRYRVPDQFAVTNVTAPGVSRWSVSEENDEQILTVHMRTPQTENLLVHITALRSAPATGSWQFPAMQPLDVMVSTGVVGVLADRRLAVNSLKAEGVISLDTGVLQRALPTSIFVVEPGAPLIRVLATYYAPQTDYSIKADIAQPENRTHVQTSTLLSLNQSDHTVAVRFSIFSELDDLYTVTIQAPGQWNITGLHDDTGAALKYHETIDEMGIRRLHAKFPGRKAFGQLHNVVLTAERVPSGWLNQWEEFHLAVPKFMMEDTFRDEGVIAIRTQSGFEQVYEIRAEQVSGVETLATAEKQEAGLSGRLALAFRYEKPQFTVAVVARRVKPVMAARLATFLNVQVGVLHTYSEINYTVQQSLVEQVQFVLPITSPSDLNVVGLGTTQIKQFVSEEQEDKRIWTVTLNKPMAGNIVIGIDYEQVLEETESKYVPMLVVAGDVVYQSGVLSIESSPELAIGVDSDAKPVDVGELVVLGYSVGKHRVGAYGYTGADPAVTLSIDRPNLFAVPSSLIQRGEIVSFVSSHGVYQSVARFELLSKASYLQVQLPSGGKLWSVVLDGKHTLKPQKVGGTEGRFLVALAVDDQNGAWLRDLRVVYEQQVADGSGEFSLEAPTLYEFNGGQVTPQQDVKLEAGKMRWQLIVPGSYVIQPYADSSMRLVQQPEQVPQVVYAAGTVFIASGGVLLHADAAMVDSPAADMAVASTMEMMPQNESGGMDSDAEQLAEGESPFGGAMNEPTITQSEVKSKKSADGLDSIEEHAASDMPAPPGSPEGSAPGEDPFSESAQNQQANGQPQSPDPGDPVLDGKPNADDLNYSAGTQMGDHSYKNSQIWALQGMKSLNVDLLNKSRDAQGDIDVEWMDFVRYDFQSLGGSPRLSGKVVRKSFVTIWAWVIGLAVLTVGLALTSLSTKAKRNYVFGLLIVLALVSAMPAWAFYRPVTEVSFVMVLLIALYYLLHHLLQSGWQWFRQAALSKI